MSEFKSSLRDQSQSTNNIGFQSFTTSNSGIVSNSNSIEASINAQKSSQVVNAQIAKLQTLSQDVQKKTASIDMSQLSAIIEEIWDSFEEMSLLGKILTCLGSALIVGATGYFAYKQIAANWESISDFVEKEVENFEELIKKSGIQIEEGSFLFLASFMNLFSKRLEDTTPSVKNINTDSVKNVIAEFSGFGGDKIIASFIKMLGTK